ncbi:uroporphyrinogen-III synthase domain protein [Mycobacterium ulcerans str. Harvey]|uniref:Uroporphyrinogen-III synthase domain protein n=1 Tax=Mycobacterium ulcerans str. Harvey TaxID=1299332 RepID=A0ABP3A8T2_MYCUL|nr:uroporphyrinogen-III synthase domain protein [Mycobacterium ulcerans str. Harvey]
MVTIGKTVSNRAKLNWWESRALYGWTVLVPRTKDQAGEMSERLTSYGALPVEVPTIAVAPPRSRRRWNARSKAWSTAGSNGSCSPPPTPCARCGRSSASSAWMPGRSPE